MGWLGFCQAAFPVERTALTCIDFLGYAWTLMMDFCHDEDVSCVFFDEWPALCTARKLAAGTKVKFGVTQTANNRTVFMCPPPMLVLRTTVPPPASTCEDLLAFRVEQYFWAN